MAKSVFFIYIKHCYLLAILRRVLNLYASFWNLNMMICINIKKHHRH